LASSSYTFDRILSTRQKASGATEIKPSLAGATDEELAAKAAGGSSDHFEALVRRYTTAIYRVGYRLTGNTAEAEDIAQETFIKVFRALPKTRLDLPFKPWLYKIAVNTAISHWRKNKDRYQVDLEAADSLTQTGDTGDMVAVRQDIQAAINRLEIDYRRIGVLRVAEDLSFAEIGQVLDIPEATARTRFNRAKTKLQLYLSK